MFDQNLEELAKIIEKETEDLDIVVDANHELKEKYCINLNFIGRNLYNIDDSFCETMLECKKKVLDTNPDRIINLPGMKNSNEKLDSIESIVEEIESTSNTTLDLSYLGIRPFELKNNIVPAMLNNKNI